MTSIKSTRAKSTRALEHSGGVEKAAAKKKTTVKALHNLKAPKLGGTKNAAVALLKQKPTLTTEEKGAYQRATVGLAYLQELWPTRINANNTQGSYGLMRDLPKEIGDRLRADLEPIANAIAHVQVAMRSYETQTNVPRDYKAPASMSQTMDSRFGEFLRQDIAESRRYLPPAVAANLEKVATAWDNRYTNPGLTFTHPQPFHRETDVEALAKFAGVKLGQYPDAHLFEAKQAWAAGERTVVFDQSIGNSTGMSMGVPRRYNNEAEFIRNHCRARTGTFGHWQDI